MTTTPNPMSNDLPRSMYESSAQTNVPPSVGVSVNGISLQGMLFSFEGVDF